MKVKRNCKICIYFLAMLMIILDSKTASRGAAEGIKLCIQTVIPSLFPMMILSATVTSLLDGRKMAVLRPFGRLCGIPEGAESLLAIGLLGGYPIGAQAVARSHKDGTITTSQAKHMLTFCSNAGPSFIFGMCASLFTSPVTCWLIWLIHILSALFTGSLLNRQMPAKTKMNRKRPITLPQAVASSVKTMGVVCGWIVIMRVMLQFMEHWFFWCISEPVRILMGGILELSNGICQLKLFPSESVRFILCCCLLSFGGICVLLQTVSVTDHLGIREYCIGKLIQTAVTLFLAFPVQQFLYRNKIAGIWSLALQLFIIVSIIIFKKRVAFSKSFLYNGKKHNLRYPL